MEPSVHRSLKPFLFTISLLLTVPVLGASAQTQECRRLSEQLLEELNVEAGQAASVEATAQMQREVLRSRGCDLQQTGYDMGVEGIRLNRELDDRPRKKQPFRLDQLLRIQY
jgi:hypothetical protein